MFIEVTKGDAAALVGPDSRTGRSAMVLGDIVFVADSAEAVGELRDAVARWHELLLRESEGEVSS